MPILPSFIVSYLHTIHTALGVYNRFDSYYNILYIYNLMHITLTTKNKK